MSYQIVNFRPSDEQRWTREAACAADGVGSMYPHDEDYEGIDNAKGICRRCPVSEACLDAALSRNEKFGVWGGTTPNERNSKRRAEANRRARSR